MSLVDEILAKKTFSKEDLIILLQLEGDDKQKLFHESARIKEKHIGNIVHLRGLIELSNICRKDCLYCGIRISNKNTKRYNLSDDEVMQCADFAYKSNYGSIVIQSGELMKDTFVDRIECLLRNIKKQTNNELGITLSLGEQSEETYSRWFIAGAHRYLLRIEASNRELYAKLHPADKNHDYDYRLNCLHLLKKIGFQVGTGVMIGMPFQTMEDLADDLIFMKDLDIDMCGMGPYVEHQDTPLYVYKENLMPKIARFELTLKMIAILRILMKNINIAATTAMQAIVPDGREAAIKAGANIIMPNISPVKYRNLYELYEGKPCTTEDASHCLPCTELRIKSINNSIGYGKWGDSKHFKGQNN